MVVKVDATGTALITTVAGASVNYTGITVGTGVDRALVVTVACAAAVTAPNAHWDTAGANQAMTLITAVETQTNITTFMFGLRNPVAGAKTLNVAWTTSAASNIEAISFTDVDQTSDARAFINANFVKDAATVSSILMGLVSPADSIAVASYGTSATFSSLTGTNLFTDTTNTGCEGAASRSNGAGATINFTGADTSTAGNKVMVGFVVAPVIPVSPPPLSDPVRPKIAGALAIAIMASGLFSGPLPPKEDIAKVDRWYSAWREPVWPKKGLAAHEQQFFASPGLTKEDIPKQEWTTLWQDPVRVRPALGIQHQAASAFLPLVPTATTLADWPDFAKAKPRAIEVQPLPFGPFPIAATTPTGWNDPLEVPVRNWQRSIAYIAPFLALGVPPAQVWFPHAPWDDFARRKQPPLDTQPPAWNSFQFTTTAPTMAWTNWPDFAPKAKPLVDIRPWTFVPTPKQVFFPYAPWDDFTRRARPSTDPQSFAFLPLVPTASVIGDWPDFATRKPQPLDTQPQPYFLAPQPAQYQTVVYDWPDFASRKPQLPDTQPLIWGAFTPAPAAAFFLVPDRWPDFATKKRPLNYDPLAFLQTVTSPFNSFVNWPDFATKKKPAADFIPWTFIPSPRQVFFPYGPWDDFARRGRPLNYDPLAFLQTVRTPWVTMTTWPDFAPIRSKIGLHPAQQQFTARFAGIISATTVTITMSAFEVNTDGAAGAILVVQSQPAVDAAVAIKEIGILGGSVTP